MTPTLAVEIWSDVMCPWCAVGYMRFAEAVRQLEGEVAVEIRWMPFELNPDMPAQGKSQAQHLAQMYGRSPEEVAAMQAQMAAVGEQAGFPMRFAGADGGPAMMWNTFEAHKLLRWALGAGERGGGGADAAEAGAAAGALPAGRADRGAGGAAGDRRG